MMKSDYLVDALIACDTDVANAKIEAKQRKKHLRLKSKLLRELEYKSGINLIRNAWDFYSRTEVLHVKQTDMHEIKKVTGEVKDAGVDMAYDYEDTKEILVNMKPIAGDYTDLTFQYRRRHLDSDPCKVETVEPKNTSYQRLVCPTK